MRNWTAILIRVQSLYWFKRVTCRSGSWGRLRMSLKNDCKQSRKAEGVHNSLWSSKWERRRLNSASTSSWLWPELKKLSSAPATLWRATHMAIRRSTELFLISFVQLSACTLMKQLVRSVFWATIVSPAERISADLEEFVDTVCDDNASNVRYPWTIIVVLEGLGLTKEANSFEAIDRLRGHECFWASILSMMMVISRESPNDAAPNLERALAPQYTCLSRSCLSRCLWSSACCARNAGGQWPSFLMISLCFTHCEQRAWWLKNLIRNNPSKSLCHTLATGWKMMVDQINHQLFFGNHHKCEIKTNNLLMHNYGHIIHS